MGQFQTDFLAKAYAAACTAGHIYPEYAACEAALESAWGQSRLAREGNNLFGQKQSHPPLPGTETLEMQTHEFLRREWVVVDASWVKFASWEDCFRQRMALLERLREAYPHYAAALVARSGEQFLEEVSMNWSTDPQRAAKVIAMHTQHQGAFAQPMDLA